MNITFEFRRDLARYVFNNKRRSVQRLYKVNNIAKLAQSKDLYLLFCILINRLFQIKQNISTQILHGNHAFTKNIVEINLLEKY